MLIFNVNAIFEIFVSFDPLLNILKCLKHSLLSELTYWSPFHKTTLTTLILATALKSYIEWLLYIYFFFFWKSLKKLKKMGFLGLNFSYTVLNPLYSERYHIPKHLSVYIWLLINLLDFLTNIKGNQQVQRQMENHWHQCMTCCGLFVHT